VGRRAPQEADDVLEHEHEGEGEQELEALVPLVDGPEHPLHRGPHRGQGQPAQDEDGQEQRGGDAHRQGPRHRGHAEVGPQGIEGAAGEIEDLLDSEDELQPGRHQKQHGGVEHAAEHDVDALRDQGRPALRPSRS
jgi:hypothetical protein